jgi:hypothetical protein
VVLVRRARVALSVSASTADGMAVQAGRALEGALRGTLRRPHSADDVLVFDSTAEYVAHFVEELAGGRAVDVWYFNPLRACRGRGLADTLANLARAEPQAWPDVLRILRRRGLLAPLQARLSGADRDLLRGVPAPPGRPLEHAEGWPLFAIAWEAAVAALQAASADGAAASLGGTAEAAFGRYRETQPAAPESWGEAAALGACVAEMLRWLLDAAAAAIDTPAAESALARHGWIDAEPARRALRESAEASRRRRASADPASFVDENGVARNGRRDGADAFASTGTPVDEDAPALRPRAPTVSINRTQALRYLHAARLLASPAAPPPVASAVSPDDPLLEYEDEVWTIDAAAARLAASGATPTPERVLALLDAPPSASPDLRDRPMATLAAAARRMEDAERRELASALSRLARARPTLLETRASGLFFLLRPLVDLGVPGLAARAGLPQPALRTLLHAAATRAADAPAGDPAAELFAWGWMRGEWDHAPAAVADDDPCLADFAAALRTMAARHGLALSEAADGAEDLPGLLLEAACLQLVRWLRGFESSSVEYTLARFVRRPGAVHVPAAGAVEVRWPASGYDVVLERAGYLDPLGSVPWWDRRGVRWQR